MHDPKGLLLGEMAVKQGFLTEAQLDACIQQQIDERYQALRAQARKHARGIRSKLGQVMLEFGIITIAQFWEIIHEQGDFMCGTCGSRIQKPIFRGSSVVCEGCKSPAFQVTAESAGPKPRRRKADRR